MKDRTFQSTLGIKYPSLRDHPLHSSYTWLQGKHMDDGAEGLWRIHDKLYDLSNFIERHPGGRDWIELTKGTDITEAFESHHLTPKAEEMRHKFFVRDAKTPRVFPFTFHENGFYKVLKRRVVQKLKDLPTKPVDRSKLLIDALFGSYLSTFLLTVYFRSFLLGAVSGVCLGMLTIAAHNFFHQKENLRRFYFDFSLMSSREWRVSHVLSHHMYTNTISDMEISSLEPLLQYLPDRQKGILVRYGSWLYSPVLFAVMFIVQYVKTLISNFLKKDQLVAWQTFLPFTVPIFAWLITGQPLWACAGMFLWVVAVAGTHFGIASLNGAHHHPETFHDGDAARPNYEMDWGVFQMDTCRDRKELTGNHFLGLTNFGDHALHHLFPTLDHGVLDYLYPTLFETCEEFGYKFDFVDQLTVVKGQYRQLANVSPNKNPPEKLAKVNL